MGAFRNAEVLIGPETCRPEPTGMLAFPSGSEAPCDTRKGRLNFWRQRSVALQENDEVLCVPFPFADFCVSRSGAGCVGPPP
jgi:hypothetical protein